MAPGALDDVAGEPFEFLACEPAAEAEVRGEKGQGNFHFGFGREPNLRSLRRFADARQGGQASRLSLGGIGCWENFRLASWVAGGQSGRLSHLGAPRFADLPGQKFDEPLVE